MITEDKKMIEITNPSIAKATLKIVQKKDKNKFEANIHDAVNMIRHNTVCFDKVDIKSMGHDWKLILSKGADSNKLNRFKNDVEHSFMDFDITPSEYFDTILNEHKES